MKKKNIRNTKGRIVSTAWKLFYEQGYEDTTVDDIIYESETSKGSFYHFDDKYEELSDRLDGMGYIEQLLFLNRELFRMIEDTVSIELLARLLSSQLITKSEKHLLDHDRTYYKLLRSIILAGQQSGELRDDVSVNDIVKAYAMYERAIMYDWCLCGGDYSLCSYSARMLPLLMRSYTSEAAAAEKTCTEESRTNQ